MGSTTSKSSISAGAEHALGQDIATDLSEMIGKNVDAATIANIIEFMPVSDKPVDDNLIKFMEENATLLIGTIREITGLKSDKLPDKTIFNIIKLARKYGIIAIPYVVGIIAVVATALGVPVPVGMAFTAAQTAVKIADQIENEFITRLSAIHTPEFLKNLRSQFSTAKQAIGSMLSRKGSFEGAYDELKKTYGSRVGACDCDKIGGAEEETSLVAAREYLRTSSSAAKTALSQKIIEAMSKFIKLDPPKGLTDVERANWLLAHLPGGPENKNNISLDKLDAACNALINILNTFMGREIIRKDLDNTTKCAQAAELLHSLTAGMHIEFLGIQQDLQNIESNLDYLASTEQLLLEEVINKTQPDMTEGDRIDVLAKKDALKLVSEEIQRQLSMVKALTTGTINETDRDILKLIKDGTILRAEISEISDKNPSNKSFRQMLYKLLDMTVIAGAVAAYLESALRIVGIKVDDYKNMNALSQLDEAIIKLTPRDGDTETLTKFFKAVDILKQNFARRKDMKTGAYQGGRARYPPTESEKKMDARKNLRAIQLKAFANQLIRIYGEIERSLDEIVPHVGESISHGDELDLFIERLVFLHEDKTLKGKTFEAMSGAVVDPLALQIRMEIIGRFKSLVSIIDVLANKSNGIGKDALLKLRKAIDDLIKLSDDTAEQFKKIIGSNDAREGGVDLSESFAVDYGIGRSVLNLEKAIERMQAYSKVAKVRDNIKSIATDYKGIDADYEALVGQSVAGMINEINNVQRLITERIDATENGLVAVDEKKRCKFAREFITSQMEAVRNVWKASEAVDYYLGNFTHDIRLSSSEIRDITALLEDVAVHKDWYDDKLGNILTGVFDNFPVKFSATNVAEYPSDEIINNPGEKHYYELIGQAGASPGDPFLGADILNHGLDAIKKAKAFSSRFVVLKNIVTLFYDLGSKYGREKTKDSSKYMSPGSLLKVLMEYFTYGSFSLISDVELQEIGRVRAEIDKVSSIDKADNVDAVLRGISANEKIRLSKIVMDAFGVGLEEFIRNCKEDSVTERGLGRTAAGNTKYDKTVLSNPDGPFSIFLRSENYKFLRGGSLMVKTDQMFCCLIKSMLAKILTCVETFEIMKRPMMYNVYNSGVRQILGGAEAVIRPEYTELYIRLPLLVRFYKHIFSIDDPTRDFEPYNRLDRSASRNLKISMMPDIDGLYGPLTQYMFSNDRLGVNNYTDSQMAVIIEKINSIIDATQGSGPEDKTKAVIKGFIKEINRRFTLVTEEDMQKYKEMVQKEHNLWGQLKVNPAESYVTGTIVLDSDQELDAFMKLPSDSYVTTTGFARGIRGAERYDSIDRKYYGEYYLLYTRFRQMLDKYIMDNTITPTPKPKMSYALEAIEKQIKLENNPQKKLEIISKFLDEGVNLSDVEKAKYVAFHEFIVASINSLSMIDAFITYIISVAYIIDPVGLGNAIILRRMSSGLPGNVTFASLNTEIDAITMSNGINKKVLKKIIGLFTGTPNAIIAAGTMNTADDYGKNTALRNSDVLRDVMTKHILNILYAVSGNKLFSMRISDSGITVDYESLQVSIEKTYASVKSSMEKFRPYIDDAFYKLYSGVIAEDVNANTVYKLYDDLIRVKLHGKEVFGNSAQDKVDSILGRYYGLRQAFTCISNYSKEMKNHDSLRQLIISESIYELGQADLGTISGMTGPAGLSLGILEPIRWFDARGSSIERMHMAVNGDKSTIDLRFGGRYTSLYSWDGEFNMNRTLFFSMNQLVARFLGRCFDTSLEKVYKGCLGPFDKIFANECNDPFNNAWPDIWPGIYRNKDNVLKAVISDKDSYAYTLSPDMFPVDPTNNPKSTFSVLLTEDLNRPTISDILGIQKTTYPESSLLNARNVPGPENMLLASIANIVRNIKGNKTGSGTPANIAESLSEISQVTKDIMREEMPIFKKYFAELGTRAQLLKDMAEKFSSDGNFPVIAAVIYPAQIKSTGVNIKSYLTRFFSKIIDIAEVFEKASDDLIKELNVTSEYGELFPGFIKTYQAKFGSLPLVPPSLIFSYVFNRPTIANDAGKNIQFIPSTKSSASRYLSTFIQGADRAAASPIIDMIIKNFDATINGPEQLRQEDIKNAVSGYIDLVKYIGECRQYKSMFTLPVDKYIIKSNITGDLMPFFYPEIVTNAGTQYGKVGRDIDVVCPWNVNYFVDESSSTNPGIVLQQAPAAGQTRYTNVIFITMSAAELLNKIATSTIHEIMLMIFDKFGVSPVPLGGTRENINPLIVANILDMNIVPIDFSGFSRFIPFSNIMNYSYTLEKIAMDVLIKNDSEKMTISARLANDQAINVNNTECYIYGLLINPFAPMNDAFLDNQIQMFRGISQTSLGRPKFLSDQIFQKLLFGEMFVSRRQYEERGSSSRRTWTSSIMSPSNTLIADGLEMSMIRGAGEIDGIRNDAYGFNFLKMYCDFLLEAINQNNDKIYVSYEIFDLNDPSKNTYVEFTVNIEGQPRQTAVWRLGRLLTAGDIWNAQFDITAVGNNKILTVHRPASTTALITLTISDVTNVIATVTNANTKQWPADFAIPIIDNFISMEEQPRIIYTRSFATATDYFTAVHASMFNEATKIIRDNIYDDKILRLIPDIDNIVIDLLTDYISPTITDRMRPINAVLAKKTSTQTNKNILDNCGPINAWIASDKTLAVILFLLYDFKSFDLANDKAIELRNSGQIPNSNLAGFEGIQFFMNYMRTNRFIEEAELFNVSYQTSNITSAAAGYKQRSAHPLAGYFRASDKFEPSFKGDKINNNINSASSLSYIDPKQVGVSRIRYVPITANKKESLMKIGRARYNTVLVRFIVFIVNAYRIVLNRLRDDAKNRTGKIAVKPEEILDDGDTEFIGFDMIE